MKLGLLFSIIFLLTSLPLFADTGLVAHYTFEKINGSIAPDSSGKGNDGRLMGGVKQVTGRWGSALEFDGVDGCVECGSSPGLDMTAAGTVAVWCRPGENIKGGVIARASGGNWEDMRLLLAVYTWRRNEEPWMAGAIADGRRCNYFGSFPALASGKWSHMAFTYDGKTINVYADGVLTYSMEQTVTPDMKNVPLYIGRCKGGGLGDEYFDGMIDDVRVYNRALSHSEILAIYKSDAAKRGHDLSVFGKPVVKAAVYDVPGKAVVTIDAGMLQPLPTKAGVLVELIRPAGPREFVKQAQIVSISRVGDSEAIFDIKKLPFGRYVAAVQVRDAKGKPIGKQVRTEIKYTSPPPEWKGIRILNNLCWELLNLKAKPGQALSKTLSFSLPLDRWVFVQASADHKQQGGAWVEIDGLHRVVDLKPGDARAEGMVWLKAGKHRLSVITAGKTRLTRMVVRAVPELQYAFYGASSDIAPYGPYDWQFLSKDILPNINTIIGLTDAGDLPLSKEQMDEITRWRSSGKRWLTLIHRPDVPGFTEADVQQALDFWSKSPGLSQEYLDGIMVDEFEGTDHPSFDAYRMAVQEMFRRFPGKVFRPYFVRPWGGKRAAGFFRAVTDRGDLAYSENYLSEPRNEAEARQLLSTIPSYFAEMQQQFTGSAMKSGITLSNSCAPTISINTHADIDYRKWQDMQFQLLATHPALFGLAGIQEYHSGYCDEEILRLTGRLMRHYALEGSAQPYIKDPLTLIHISNPEFVKGTAGWSVSPVEEGSVQAGMLRGYAKLQGRYAGGSDTFLLTRRSERKPNTFSQRIVNLVPGRLYSLKIITGDCDDLANEVSEKKQHAINIQLLKCQPLSGPGQSFDYPFPNNYSHSLGKFNASYKYWMNFHWRVFRATGKTARVVVSDWNSNTDPAGPVGQQLMFSFVEIQPYMK